MVTKTALILAIAVFCSVPAHAQTCSRDSLKAIAADYFKAVETHEMSALATAANVRITENANEIGPGEGFFKTGGKAVFQRTVVDRERCSTLTQAVVEETREGKAARALIAVRLRSGGGKVSEIETIIAREGNFAFNPQGVIATADQDWETLMPEGKRLTREQMNRQSNTYYDMMEDPKNDPGFATPCRRWENGTYTTPNGDCYWRGATMKHPPRRLPVTDVEMGVAATIHNFRDDWLDVHLFKFDANGKIALIQSVDGPGTRGTGWPLDR
jgi:hypothetical protein